MSFVSNLLFPSSRRTRTGPETCSSDISHDFYLSRLKHLDHLRESRSLIGVKIPAAGHDIRYDRQAIIGDYWTGAFVDNSKSSLHSSHARVRKQPCYELSQINAKTIKINFLGV